MLLAVHGDAPISLSVSSVNRCIETGAFRFVFETPEGYLAADLTVCWLEDKGSAFLRFITVDGVIGADRALERALEAWVTTHESEVLDIALRSG